MKPNKEDTLKNDYERMVPEFHKGTLTYAEHITRYKAAQDLVTDKIVLDIASGSGYGTKLLAEKAKYIYGVDVNEPAINYSKKHYGANNIEYLLGDGESIPLKNNTVDVVTTFETIEHIKDYKKFLKEIKRVLKSEGLLLLSTPNDLEFTEGNHFHLHEFEHGELTTLLRKDFKYLKPYYQATWKYVALGSSNTFENEGQFKIENLNLAPKTVEKYIYFYFLCSNREITEAIRSIGALGDHFSDKQQAEIKHTAIKYREQNKKLEQQLGLIKTELDQIKLSRSFKLSSRLAKALAFIKKAKK